MVASARLETHCAATVTSRLASRAVQEPLSLNQRVPGSSPGAPTTPSIFSNDFNRWDTIFLQPQVMG